MKLRRLFAITMCLLLLLLIVGCSAQSGEAMPGTAGMGYDANYESGKLNGSSSGNSAGSDVLADRKLIRKIRTEAETEDMDALLESVNARVAELGGYIESRNIQNGSQYSGYYRRTATLVIRIPADQLDAFVDQVGKVSNIVSTVEDSDDVTLQYAATESRLAVLRTEEERLLQFLSEAKSVSEMLEIEKRLTEVQSEIESITTQLNTYDNLVSYGTLTLTVTEVEVYTQVEEKEPTLWEEISVGFARSIQVLLAIGRGLLVFLLANSPYFVILGVIAVVVLLILRRRRKSVVKNITSDPKNE